MAEAQFTIIFRFPEINPLSLHDFVHEALTAQNEPCLYSSLCSPCLSVMQLTDTYWFETHLKCQFRNKNFKVPKQNISEEHLTNMGTFC